MSAFFINSFSMVTRRLTPSMTIWTSSTSEKPSRSALEMSKVPFSLAVSTPPVPDKFKKKNLLEKNECKGNKVETYCSGARLKFSKNYSIINFLTNQKFYNGNWKNM